MESLEVQASGERILVIRREWDGVDKPVRTTIEDMSITRAVGFRGELDDAILQAQEVRAEKVRARQKELIAQIAELQQELQSCVPPGTITGVTVNGLQPPVVTVKQPDPAPAPRRRPLQPSDEIIY